LGASNEAIRLIERLAQHFEDGRDRDALLHQVPSLLGQRIFGIALGYEDVNDHNRLRHDPVLQVLAGQAHRQAVELPGATADGAKVEIARIAPGLAARAYPNASALITGVMMFNANL
jgi:hypothetical protein